MPQVVDPVWQGLQTQRSGYRGSNKYYTGKLDELRMWTTARAQDEIQANMARRLNGCEDGLSLYYDFNEGGGKTEGVIARAIFFSPR